MSFARGEVILLPIPFSDLSSRKVRPAVIIGLSRHSGDLFVVPISSQLQNTEVTLGDWSSAGLNVPCGIKSQIATIEDRLVIKSLGFLSPKDRSALEVELKAWLGLA
jgi:mRNA interferase MazF